MDEVEDGGEAGAHAVEGHEEDGEDLRDRDVEDQVLLVVGCWLREGGLARVRRKGGVG